MFCVCSFHGNSTNNLLSYCGLLGARISASERDLPVKGGKFKISAQRRNLAPFLGNGTKVKIPSEIKLPLAILQG
mgnify:CR=1 FL=1